MADARGLVRVSFAGKQTKLEYRRVPKKGRDEALQMALAHFAFEHDADGQKVPLPASTITAEWVENEGTPNETVEKMTVPEPKK